MDDDSGEGVKIEGEGFIVAMTIEFDRLLRKQCRRIEIFEVK